MLGHITYLSREAMTQKFDAERFQPRDVQTQFETKFSVGSYLAYQGDRFGERFDAEQLPHADDGHRPVRPGRHERETGRRLPRVEMPLADDEFHQRLALSAVPNAGDGRCADRRRQARQLLQHRKPTAATTPFCCRTRFDIYGEMMRAFLANLDERRRATFARATWERNRRARLEGIADAEHPQRPASDSAVLHDSAPTPSIFQHHRLDYETILDLIPPGASVLDLGCGTGELLARLRERGHRRIIGVELDEQAILACVRRGLDVVQADLNRGLPAFTDGQFDFVVLSQTLQTVLDVPRVLSDMLRVGRRAIVSFPNFAYKKHRRQLAEEGRTPRSLALNFPWYDTPNVRFLSIIDFEEFCRKFNFRILQQIALDTEADKQVHDDPEPQRRRGDCRLKSVKAGPERQLTTVCFPMKRENTRCQMSLQVAAAPLIAVADFLRFRMWQRHLPASGDWRRTEPHSAR